MRRLVLAALLMSCLAAAWIGGRLDAGELLIPADLAGAAAKARAGDTLVVADGTYTDQQVVLRAKGEPGKPVVVRAATPGKVVLTGASSIELRGAWLTLEGFVFRECSVTPITVRDSQNCRITECAVLRCNPPGKRLHWIRIAGGESRDNRVDHCFTEGKLADGVVLVVEGDAGKMPQRTRIDHNRFTNVVKAVRNGMETIRVGTSGFGQMDSHTLVEENLFENCSGDAEIISSKSCGNAYRYNRFVGCHGGITMRHGHRSVVEGNWVFGEGREGSAGIRVHGSDHRVFNNYIERVGAFGISLPSGQSKFVPTGHEPTVNAVVAHNTIVNPEGPGLLIGADASLLRDTAPAGIQLLNNVIIGSPGLLVEERQPGGARWAGNFVFARAPGRAGIAERAGVLFADPKLKRGWALDAGSPAIGAAAPVPFAIPTDIGGRARGERPDSGADQYSTDPPVRLPPDRSRTGPSWQRN